MSNFRGNGNLKVLVFKPGSEPKLGRKDGIDFYILGQKGELFERAVKKVKFDASVVFRSARSAVNIANSAFLRGFPGPIGFLAEDGAFLEEELPKEITRSLEGAFRAENLMLLVDRIVPDRRPALTAPYRKRKAPPLGLTSRQTERLGEELAGAKASGLTLVEAAIKFTYREKLEVTPESLVRKYQRKKKNG